MPEGDTAYRRAVDASAVPALPPTDMFRGDRYNRLWDPFGHMRALSEIREELTPEEIQEQMRGLPHKKKGDRMKLFPLALVMWSCLLVPAQTPTTKNPDPLQALEFLEGTWDAAVQNNSQVNGSGRYTFARELNGHLLARHSTSDKNCSAPASFDCAHNDLFYVFQESPNAPLKAVYFDNEGHVIHYDVSLANSHSVVFLSPPGQGPRYRLAYELAAGVMTGKFQMQMPGQTDWHTYLEWSGGHK